MKLKDLPFIEQPRGKLLRYGVEKLSIEELIAVLLGTGTRSENIIKLAKRVTRLNQNGALVSATVKELKLQAGLGTVKACSLVACFELGRRLLNGKKSQLLLSPYDVWVQLYDIREQKKEHFVVFYLDIRNQIIKREIISIGTLYASLVHPREVFEQAILDGAAQIILSHNHPSNIVDPSEEDIHLTTRLVSSGKILGIEVVDHIVVSASAYFSFKEHSLL